MKVGDLVAVKRMEHKPRNLGVVIATGKDTTSIQGPNFVEVFSYQIKVQKLRSNSAQTHRKSFDIFLLNIVKLM